jgi:hypothetical protein
LVEVSNEAKILEAMNALVDIVGEFEGRIVALENKPAVTPEERAVALSAPKEEKAKKKYVPAEWSQAGIILAAMRERGGVWNSGRALDVLEEAGHFPKGERPDSGVSVVFMKLRQEGYLIKLGHGRYMIKEGA